jgi:hypothetical protein
MNDRQRSLVLFGVTLMSKGSAWFRSAIPLACLLALGCVGETKPKGPPVVGFSRGDIAPEISGQDLDGAPFKLSDYRGKVVLLDFWGDW